MKYWTFVHMNPQQPQVKHKKWEPSEWRRASEISGFCKQGKLQDGHKKKREEQSNMSWLLPNWSILFK